MRILILKLTTAFFVLGILTAFSPFTAIAQENIPVHCVSTFHDVPPNTPECYYINYLDYQRVINGYPDLTYRSGLPVTRGQMAKFIVNAFGVSTNIPEITDENKFSDIEEDHTFFKHIYSLKESEIIDGFSDNSYRPDDHVTRSQAVKFVVNAADRKKEDIFPETANLEFVDVNTENTFYPFIARAYSATHNLSSADQILSLPEHRSFRPEDSVTRLEMAKMVTNTMQYADIQNKKSLPTFSVLSNGITPTQEISDNGFQVYHYDDWGMTILAVPDVFEFNYIPKEPPTSSELAQQLNYQYVINGSFFGGYVFDDGKLVEASHAGFLNYYGLHLTPIRDEELSSQLTHFIRYDKRDGFTEIYNRNNFEPSDGSTKILEFQTGPAIVIGNEIQKDEVYNSKNGRGAYSRTVFVRTSPTQKYFVVMRKPFSLNEVAEILLNLKIFKNESIDALNLDGGSSTTFYSANYPELNWNVHRNLPILIGLD